MVSTKQTYIAVVDDDESVCQSFGRLLRAAGLQPIIYPSAEAFLAIQSSRASTALFWMFSSRACRGLS
jgi:Response regulator